MSHNRRPRILHLGKFYPPHHGGMESHVELLCRGLRRDFEITALVAADGWRTRREHPAAGLEVVRVGTPLTLHGAPISPGMAREIRRSRPDLIHLQFPNPWAALAYFASRTRAPLIVTWQSDIVRQQLAAELIAPLLNALLSRARLLIATSPNYAQSSPALRAHRAKVRIVPLAIEPETFAHPDLARLAALRELYAPGFVLAVGRLVYYKGFEYLIDAFSQVPHAHLLIAGTGPRRRALEARARAQGLAERVKFLGEVPDLTPYYQACEVFALPSVARSEAFGIVQLEAMASGKPVVNTALESGVPFVSRHGETGLTVAPADAAALARALNQLLGDSALRAQYGAAGRRRVDTHFSAPAMLEATAKLYAEALAEAWPAPAGAPKG